MDVDHDALEFLVHLFAGPAHPQAVLAHLKSGGCHPSCIRRLSGCEQHPVGMEALYGFGRAGHVGALCDCDDFVVDEHLRLLAVNLVLSRARQRDVDIGIPESIQVGLWLGGRELDSVEVVGVLLDSATAVVLEVHDPSQLLSVDTGRVVDESAAVGHRHRLATEIENLLACELGDVARAADGDRGSLEGLALGREHLAGEVDQPVAGRLGADQGAAV